MRPSACAAARNIDAVRWVRAYGSLRPLSRLPACRIVDTHGAYRGTSAPFRTRDRCISRRRDDRRPASDRARIPLTGVAQPKLPTLRRQATFTRGPCVLVVALRYGRSAARQTAYSCVRSLPIMRSPQLMSWQIPLTQVSLLPPIGPDDARDVVRGRPRGSRFAAQPRSIAPGRSPSIGPVSFPDTSCLAREPGILIQFASTVFAADCPHSHVHQCAQVAAS